MSKSCVIYVRTSINSLCDDILDTQQVRKLRDYAEANHIHINSIVISEGECGGQDRGSLRLLYREIDRYHPDTVLVHTIDSLSQNVRQLKAIAEQIRLRGATITDIQPCLLEVSSSDVMAELSVVPKVDGGADIGPGK